MNELDWQRCFNHQDREAAAQCPECERFFCRECVTEHGGRVLCAQCLNKTGNGSAAKPFIHTWLIRSVQILLGGIIALIFFYYLGQILLSIPDSFHEGTLWQTRWWGIH